MIIGTEKGNSMDTRLKHNFGMARPEGYRKAIRVMELAERFNIPVVTLVDCELGSCEDRRLDHVEETEAHLRRRPA